MNKAFLGRGWSFPPSFDRALVRVDMLEEEEDIASSLDVLLSTAEGERAMRPEYGCNMKVLLFEGLDARMKTMMADKVETAIMQHEPRIVVEQVRLDASSELEGTILISIVYRVRSTDSRFNFVYPYYKEEGTAARRSPFVSLLPNHA